MAAWQFLMWASAISHVPGDVPSDLDGLCGFENEMTHDTFKDIPVSNVRDFVHTMKGLFVYVQDCSTYD